MLYIETFANAVDETISKKIAFRICRDHGQHYGQFIQECPGAVSKGSVNTRKLYDWLGYCTSNELII